MKKTIIASGLALAMFAPVTSAEMGGFFAGVDLQMKSSGVKVSGDNASIELGGKQATIAGINMGYTMVKSKMALMMGATADIGKTSIFKMSDDTGNVMTGEEKEHYSFYLAPGYLVTTSTMLYGKLSIHSIKTEATLTYTGGDSAKDSLKHSGLGFGAGIRTAVSENVVFYTEAERVHYEEKTDSFGVGFKPTSTIARIGLAYRF